MAARTLQGLVVAAASGHSDRVAVTYDDGSPMTADDVVFLASPLTFDPSVVDMFLALSSGAQLLVVPSVLKQTPGRLARRLFQRHKTTVMQVTPTLLTRFGQRTLKQEVLSSASPLRVLALGGEACPPPALLRSWRQEHNRTSVYNIYGITEVSCWACCHRIPESLLQSPAHAESFVPLGAPLMDTRVEVRDDEGGLVTEGEGQVFIGGEERVCLLDLEETVVPGTMRASGDWVRVRGEELEYLGRRDRLVKRHGKRVNLDSLQQLILGLPQVDACAVCLHEGLRLLAFVVPSRNQAVQQRRDPPEPPPPSGTEGTADGTDGRLRRLILDQLSLLLPSHSVPDTLLLIPALLLTPHGKVDTEALVRTFQTQRKRLCPSPGDASNLRQAVELLWQLAVCGQDVLGLPEDVPVEENSSFLSSGGDSLKALRLCEDILTATGAASADLLEVLLDGTFSDVLSHVERAARGATSEKGPLKRRSDVPSAAPGKRERKQSAAAEERWAVKVVRRAGEVVDVSIPETTVPDDARKQNPSRGGGVLDLSLSWASDTGRCVDASPLLLVRYRGEQSPQEGRATVIIGSHSHRIQALDLLSGSLVWERVLGGRIEASAAVSPCGSLVVVGCYDSCVYFLCASSGDTRWIFKTGDAVKSSPAVDPVSGLVMVGSHDGSVYALDPEDSGEVLWSYRRDAPFFSSPNGSTGRVLIGSVDGNICCLSSAGELMWEFLTNGPVFSSPCVWADHRRVLCGSHDGCLYCLSADGSLVWSFQTPGKVFSSPCVFDGSAVGRRGALVGLVSTDGTVWILDGRDGRTLASFTLKGELFSSPLVWRRSLVVGCRDDFVYCLKLAVKDEMTKE
ncbi:unnamed protein product [Tetraodon nigroviridis]|uniref:(spotted green pufferfish) hypothetical protein n=1 Tax=Tetraodon nigroviridis TaxID=99883 RepID=Q4RKX3_TETNG|nr:unnamed protein product [Tetraodon nigroviridis]